MTIKSFTDENKEYEVTVQHGKVTGCTCPDYYYHKHECKHMKIALQCIEEERVRYMYFEMALGIV